MKKIKQVTFSEALDLAQKDEKVYVIKFSEVKEKPTMVFFNTLIIGDMMKHQNDYIFCIVLEG